MEKKALLVYGKPIKKDDLEKFNENRDRDLRIVSSIAKDNGYFTKNCFLRRFRYNFK